MNGMREATLDIANKLPRQKVALVVGISLVLALMAAFRAFGTDRDYYDYWMFFENPVEYGSRMELGFQLFTVSFLSISNNFKAYLFAVALVPLLLKSYLIVRVTKHPLYWLFVYFLSLYPLHEMTQIRAALSLGFFYYATYLAVHSKQFLAGALVFLAISFHWSIAVLVLLLLLFRFIAPLDSSRRGLLLVAAMAGYIFAYYGQFLSEQIEFGHIYFDVTGESANAFSVQTASSAFICMIGLRYRRFIPPYARTWLIISIIGVILYYSLLQFQVLAYRFFQMTLFAYILWTPFLPRIPRIVSMGIILFNATTAFYLMLFANPFFE